MSCKNTGSEELDDIETLLDYGIQSSTTDGTNVFHNLSMVERRYREAALNDPARIACGQGRPAVMTAIQRFPGQGGGY